MVLYVIGLGMGSEKDITVRGLEAVRGSSKVMLERYGPLVGADKDKLAAFYGKDIVLADHPLPGCVYVTAKDEDVSFLVVGDPFSGGSAWSHPDLIFKAMELGVQVEVIHNVSPTVAVGPCGLKGSKYGQEVFVPLWDETWEPDDFYDKIRANRAVGTALQQLLKVEEKKGMEAYGPDTPCVGLSRLGQPTQEIVVGTMREVMDDIVNGLVLFCVSAFVVTCHNLSELLGVDFGEPCHSLIICGTTDADEDKVLERYRVTEERGEGTPEEQPTVGEGEAAATEKAPKPDTGDPCLINCPGVHGLSPCTTPNDTWRCDVCLGSLPNGIRAHWCKQCKYAVCTDCSLSPEDGSVKVVEFTGPFNCPGIHGLSPLTTPNDTWRCDVCLGSVPKGSRARWCKQCKYVVCTDCSLSPDDGSVKVVELTGQFNCPGVHGLSPLIAPSNGTWGCNVCLARVPKGSRAHWCEQCKYVVCTDCSLSLDDGSVKVVEVTGPFTCPGNHGLSPFTTPTDTWSCNICTGRTPEGCRAFGCRRCDHDVCINCIMNFVTTGGAAEARVEGGAVIVRASAEDAAYNRATIANIMQRQAQQQLEAAQIAQQYASASRFSYQICSCTCRCYKCLSTNDRLSLAASASSSGPSQFCSCTCSCSKCR